MGIMKTRRKWQHALLYFLTSSAVLFPLSSLLKSLLEKSNATKIFYTNISCERDNLQKGSFPQFYQFHDSPIPEKVLEIPQIFHFIWINKPLPFKYLRNIEMCFQLNSHYKIFLWIDTNSKHLQFSNLWNVRHIDSLETPKIFRSEIDIGALTDLIKYEVVLKNGGIYLDTDSVCVKEFSPVFQRSFVSHTNEPYNNIQASVFGFPMNSTFLQFVFESAKINSLREDYKNLFVFEKYGPPFFTTMFVKFNDSNINMIHQEYLVQNTSASVMFQTSDASWVDETLDGER